MDFKRFDSRLRPGAAVLGVELDEQQAERLYRYFQELRRWSKKVNLISRNTTADEIIEKHFLDSLALLSLLPDSAAKLLDVGSGAGFPGLVCKAVRPGMTTHLVEPRLKRVSFLRHVARLLQLEDIVVHGARLEDVDLDREPYFDWIVSRAVTDVADFLQICEPFRNRKSAVVCMKGPGYRKEYDAAREQQNGWYLNIKHEYRLPFSNAARVLLVFQGAEAAPAGDDR